MSGSRDIFLQAPWWFTHSHTHSHGSPEEPPQHLVDFKSCCLSSGWSRVGTLDGKGPGVKSEPGFLSLHRGGAFWKLLRGSA